MTVSLISIGLSITSIIVSTIVVSRSRRDARNCARDARNAANCARTAALSLSKADAYGTHVSVDRGQIPAGAMPPTIPIDVRRAEKQLRERQWAEARNRIRTSLAARRETATPGAGAESSRRGS